MNITGDPRFDAVDPALLPLVKSIQDNYAARDILYKQLEDQLAILDAQLEHNLKNLSHPLVATNTVLLTGMIGIANAGADKASICTNLIGRATSKAKTVLYQSCAAALKVIGGKNFGTEFGTYSTVTKKLYKVTDQRAFMNSINKLSDKYGAAALNVYSISVGKKAFDDFLKTIEDTEANAIEGVEVTTDTSDRFTPTKN